MTILIMAIDCQELNMGWIEKYMGIIKCSYEVRLDWSIGQQHFLKIAYLLQIFVNDEKLASIEYFSIDTILLWYQKLWLQWSYTERTS